MAMAARMPMITTTINSSINVKPFVAVRCRCILSPGVCGMQNGGRSAAVPHPCCSVLTVYVKQACGKAPARLVTSGDAFGRGVAARDYDRGRPDEDVTALGGLATHRRL